MNKKIYSLEAILKNGFPLSGVVFFNWGLKTADIEFSNGEKETLKLSNIIVNSEQQTSLYSQKDIYTLFFKSEQKTNPLHSNS